MAVDVSALTRFFREAELGGLLVTFTSVLQRRKRQLFAVSGVFALLTISLVALTKENPDSNNPFRVPSRGGQEHFGRDLPKEPWTRLLSGSDGFYVFENVYVRDRMLYMVPHPAAEPFPAMQKMITNRINENYTSLPATDPFFQREAIDSLASDRNGDFPDIPRLFVLTEAEAQKLMPFGRMSAYQRSDGSRWDPAATTGFWNIFRRSKIQVFEGMTFYFADDPAITGWGSLMHHLFHFLGELLLGTYHAYTASYLDPLAPVHAAPPPVPPPARLVSPFCVNWENHELQEQIVQHALGEPEVYRREDWRQLSRDRTWRMFDRVVITDRHAAHNDYWSQVNKWNKMPLIELHRPLPPSPNFFLGPQMLMTDGLEFPALPAERRGPGKSLVDGLVKVVYVDRQGSDRKFDNASHDGLVRVLDKLQTNGVTVGDRAIQIRVDVVKFENMTPREQLQVAYDTDVFVGIHGNGLTHLVWARPGATVIEVFPVGSEFRGDSRSWGSVADAVCRLHPRLRDAVNGFRSQPHRCCAYPCFASRM